MKNQSHKKNTHESSAKKSLKSIPTEVMLQAIRNHPLQKEVAQQFHVSTSSVSHYLHSRNTSFFKIKDMMAHNMSNEIIGLYVNKPHSKQ